MWGKRIAQPLYFRLLQILNYVLGYSCGTIVRVELCLQLPLTYLLLHFCCTSSAIPGTTPFKSILWNMWIPLSRWTAEKSNLENQIPLNANSNGIRLLLDDLKHTQAHTLYNVSHTPTHECMHTCTCVTIFPMHASGHLLRQVSSSSCPCNPIPVWDMTSI